MIRSEGSLAQNKSQQVSWVSKCQCSIIVHHNKCSPKLIKHTMLKCSSTFSIQCSGTVGPKAWKSGDIISEIGWSLHNPPWAGPSCCTLVRLSCHVRIIGSLWRLIGGNLRRQLIGSFQMGSILPVSGSGCCLQFIWPLIKSFHNYPFLPLLNCPNTNGFIRTVSPSLRGGRSWALLL